MICNEHNWKDAKINFRSKKTFDDYVRTYKKKMNGYNILTHKHFLIYDLLDDEERRLREIEPKSEEQRTHYEKIVREKESARIRYVYFHDLGYIYYEKNKKALGIEVEWLESEMLEHRR
jgi:hypothetical protein